MAKNTKFASQIDEETLKQLKAFAEESDKSISRILTEAVNEYLSRVRVRDEFRGAVDIVIKENEELLRRLAK